MHFTVTREYRDFFQKHGWIEVEDILTGDEQKKLDRELLKAISSRFQSHVEYFSNLSADQGFLLGHDLWRENSYLKRTFLKQEWAEIAFGLIEEKPLRFGYDQLFPAPSLLFNTQSKYAAFLEKTLSLTEMSSIQGLLCGMMLCIVPPKEPQEEEELSIFSLQKGNAIFFSPIYPISFRSLLKRSGAVYHLIVYAKANAVYRFESNDPHGPEFKRLGYNFGDRLQNSLNPIVF